LNLVQIYLDLVCISALRHQHQQFDIYINTLASTIQQFDIGTSNSVFVFST